jgi:hypothetical protein
MDSLLYTTYFRHLVDKRGNTIVMGKDNVVRRKSLEKLAKKTELPGENDRKKMTAVKINK